MAARPAHVRIRSYNVGFGDCFLLTFTYEDDRARNILIDFGSTKQSASGPAGGLVTIAKKISEDCGGKLEMVVATHRHADHISGFGGASGAIIRDLKPDLVVQPWTEDPDLAPDATAPGASAPAGAADGAGLRARALVASLSDMHALAAAALAEVPKLEASPAVPKTVTEQVRFLGEVNISNADAVRNLMTMGADRRYASFGAKLPIGRLLPGVKIDVLGPPTLRQSPAIAQQADVDSQEFWHIAARRAAAAAGRARGKGSPIFPRAKVAPSTPQEARWLIPRVDRMRGEEMLAIVRSMDGVLNNTSLILLFEIGETLLLFPGDAQIENWRYALRDSDKAGEIRKRLARARFYKVGHHGSLNATPKTLWKGFERRNAAAVPERLETMVSTLAGKHGSEARGTEVPRKPLIEELQHMSDLHNTQSLRSKKQFTIDVEFDL
jgi:hypothetical protein